MIAQQSPTKSHTVDDFVIICAIGSGCFGEVFLVRQLTTQRIYAMKVVKKRLIAKQNKLQTVFTERDLLLEFNHSFIIRIISSFQNEKKFYFLLEYCPGGELYNLLILKDKITEEQAKFYAAQIVLALDYMHEKNIVYRDLKPENIFIDKDGYIKLTDFGLSKKLKPTLDSCFSMSGIPQYLAPQILFQKECNIGVDYWCLGSLLFEMLTGSAPFYSDNLNELYNSIKYKPLQIDSDFKLTPECCDMLHRLFEKQPSHRLGMKSGLKDFQMHPWFAGIDWQLVLQKKYPAPFIPILKGETDTTYFSAQITSKKINSISSYASRDNCEDHSDKYFNNFDFNADSAEEMT